MRAVDHLLRATADAESRHFWFHGFRGFVAPLLRDAVRGRTAPIILDCGCGTGANLEMLGRFGRAYGFDLSETGLQFAREAGRKTVARGTVTSAPFPTATFDLVTSFDVLYSLEDADEHAAAGELFRLLKPGGYAIVNVAAMPMLRGDHSILGHERRRYTRRSLRHLLEQAGFTVTRLTYTNASLFPLVAAVRTYHQWRGLAGEDDAHQEITVPAAPINSVLSGLLKIESLWLRVIDNPFGSSLLCLARKPVGAGDPR
jgi:SAM-dependent methyltransferase